MSIIASSKASPATYWGFLRFQRRKGAAVEQEALVGHEAGPKRNPGDEGRHLQMPAQLVRASGKMSHIGYGTRHRQREVHMPELSTGYPQIAGGSYLLVLSLRKNHEKQKAFGKKEKAECGFF